MASREIVKKKRKSKPAINADIEETDLTGATDEVKASEDNTKPEKDTKKSKKASKNEKSKQEGIESVPGPSSRSESPSASLGTPATERRSSSPFMKNVVEPSTPRPGSATSMRSTASSVREAWTPDSQKDKPTTSNDNKDAGPSSSVVSLKDAAKNSRSRSGPGSLVSLKDQNDEQKAYVPFLYARNCIEQITDDMKNMKSRHVAIVYDIQSHYREIEDDTQSQFNVFVVCLRQQYATKVKTFRQVIEAHQLELHRKEDYWNKVITSSCEHNKKLLRDKKTLLIHNKVEIERLEKENADLLAQLNAKTDKANVALVAVQKDYEARLEEKDSTIAELRSQAEISEVDEDNENLQEENKALKDELENEKGEVRRLREQLLATGAVAVSVSQTSSATTRDEPAIIVATTTTHTSTTHGAPGSTVLAPLIATTGISDKDYQEVLIKNKKLQTEVENLQKENADWQEKYSTLFDQLRGHSQLQAKFSLLEAQYAALSVVMVSSEETKKNAEENILKAENEKMMMEEEKKQLDEELRKWEKKFEKENGRQAMEEDRPESTQELYIQQKEIEQMVTSLDNKKETFEKLKAGEVPTVPFVHAAPVVIPEPVVKTVIVESEEWRLRHELLTVEYDALQARLLAAEGQCAALTGVVMPTPETKKAAQENIVKAKEEKATAMKHRQKVDKEIRKWEKKFEKDNGHQPTEEERSTAPHQLYAQKKEINQNVTTLEIKMETLESLKSGQVPETPVVQTTTEIIPTTPAVITETETVEVMVQDPELAAELERAQNEIADLLRQLEQQKILLGTQLGLVATRDQELTEMKNERREMHKDIKRMIRQNDKQQAKLKDAAKSRELQQLLDVVAIQTHAICSKETSAAQEVDRRLDVSRQRETELHAIYSTDKQAVKDWAQNFKAKNGADPKEKDRDSAAMTLLDAAEKDEKEWRKMKLQVAALTLMKTGAVADKDLPAAARPGSAKKAADVEDQNEKLEEQISSLDDKVTDLESENEAFKSDKQQLEMKIKDLEKTIVELRTQLAQATVVSAVPVTVVTSEDQDASELTEEMSVLQKQTDDLDKALHQEKTTHGQTQDELEELKRKLEAAQTEVAIARVEMQSKVISVRSSLEAVIREKDKLIQEMKSRNDVLETEKIKNVPVDAAKEIKLFRNKAISLEKEKSTSTATIAELQVQLTEANAKLESATKQLATLMTAGKKLEARLKSINAEKDKTVKDLLAQQEKKQQQRAAEERKKQAALEKKIQELETSGGRSAGKGKGTAAVAGPDPSKALKEQVLSLKKEILELNNKIKQLEVELKNRKAEDNSAAAALQEKQISKRHEKILKELEKRYDSEKRKTEKQEENLNIKDDELKALQKSHNDLENQLMKMQADMAALGIAAKEGVEAAVKVKSLESEVKKMTEDNHILNENFNSERVLRKKYYNMVEDMKGKIRVYCRSRPLSKTELNAGNVSVVKSSDEYTLSINSTRGLKEFQYDQVFMDDSTQEKIFEDTNNLIQSSVDGYNVCIFAYGQTGSGKTFTMIGDKEQNFPGIAPRSFKRIFELIDENKDKLTITVSSYMLELYNNNLIDLYAKPGVTSDLDIKKDQKGMVYVQGSIVKSARNAKELFALFEEGSKNRHTASTLMNAESSRSHLVVGIILESVNKATGQVLKGKLSLVDLAGSERAAKTQSSAEQLKEAMSINKSLSALGDVISALSSEQSFIPYRNNKLTMLMQDSLGGNAKTLMFVNISPANYNMDESVISLTYASRVKLITNDATKNADNKEIAKLRTIIAMMKQGESVEEET